MWSGLWGFLSHTILLKKSYPHYFRCQIHLKFGMKLTGHGFYLLVRSFFNPIHLWLHNMWYCYISHYRCRFIAFRNSMHRTTLVQSRLHDTRVFVVSIATILIFTCFSITLAHFCSGLRPQRNIHSFVYSAPSDYINLCLSFFVWGWGNFILV